MCVFVHRYIITFKSSLCYGPLKYCISDDKYLLHCSVNYYYLYPSRNHCPMPVYGPPQFSLIFNSIPAKLHINLPSYNKYFFISFTDSYFYNFHFSVYYYTALSFSGRSLRRLIINFWWQHQLKKIIKNW